MPRMQSMLGGGSYTAPTPEDLVVELLRSPFSGDEGPREMMLGTLPAIRGFLPEERDYDVPDEVVDDVDLFLALYDRAGMGRYTPLPLSNRVALERHRVDLDLGGSPTEEARVPPILDLWVARDDRFHVETFDGRIYAIERATRSPWHPDLWVASYGYEHWGEIYLHADGEPDTQWPSPYPDLDEATRFATPQDALHAVRLHDAWFRRAADIRRAEQSLYPKLLMPRGPLAAVEEAEVTWIAAARAEVRRRAEWVADAPARAERERLRREREAVEVWAAAGLPGEPRAAAFEFTPRIGAAFDSWAFFGGEPEPFRFTDPSPRRLSVAFESGPTADAWVATPDDLDHPGDWQVVREVDEPDFVVPIRVELLPGTWREVES